MHNEGNCKQDENIAFRVGESNSKESNWQRINLQNMSDILIILSWNWKKPAWLQAILHSYSHQDSTVLAQRQKYRSMEENRKPRDKSTHQWTTKEARIYNGEKTISLTSGAGKTS